MRKFATSLFSVITVILWAGLAMAEFEFNGQADNSLDSLGYYYCITGGLFPTGSPPDGNNGSGGTFRWLSDDPTWGSWSLPINKWHKDDWFPENAGLALTLMIGNSIVYDNNGIEDGSGAALYDYSDSPDFYPLLYRGYCMVNNWDWIYATYFKLENETTFDTIIGYFDPNSGFDPYSPLISYHISIWSSYQDMPTTRPTSWMPAVDSFTGDVLDSLSTPGTFFISDTGVERVFPSEWGWDPDPIWRVVYELDTPFTLPPGVYFFSHNAVILGEITIDGCNSGVMLLPSAAQSLSASLDECSADIKNHGQYMECVSKVLSDAVKGGIISGSNKGAIESCAGRSEIGKK